MEGKARLGSGRRQRLTVHPASQEVLHRPVTLGTEALGPLAGRLEPVQRLAAQLHEQIDAMVAIAVAADCAARDARHAALRAGLRQLYVGRALRHGWSGGEDEAARLLAIDIELNAQGLGVWLDRLVGQRPS